MTTPAASTVRLASPINDLSRKQKQKQKEAYLWDLSNLLVALAGHWRRIRAALTCQHELGAQPVVPWSISSELCLCVRGALRDRLVSSSSPFIGKNIKCCSRPSFAGSWASIVDCVWTWKMIKIDDARVGKVAGEDTHSVSVVWIYLCLSPLTYHLLTPKCSSQLFLCFSLLELVRVLAGKFARPKLARDK